MARLVDVSRLPQPLAERQADRAALLASSDRMATSAGAENRRHHDRPSALIDSLPGRTAMPSTIDGLLVQWADRLF